MHAPHLICDEIPVFVNQLDLFRRKRRRLVDVLREIGLILLFYQHLDPSRRGGCASSSPHPSLLGSFSCSNTRYMTPPMTALCPCLLRPSVCFTPGPLGTDVSRVWHSQVFCFFSLCSTHTLRGACFTYEYAERRKIRPLYLLTNE